MMLPTREEAAIVGLMLSDKFPQMPAEFLRAPTRTLLNAYCQGDLLSRVEWEATIRDKAKIVLTDAMMYGNNTAAWNGGADRDYYEQEADWYLGELLAAVKGET